MLGFIFDVLFQGVPWTRIILGLVAIYLSKNIFIFVKEHMKIIAFAMTLPSPPTIPFIGSYQGISFTNNILNILTDWNHHIKKTFSVWIGVVPKIIITDPRDIEILLMNSTAVEKDLDFYKSAIRFTQDSLLMGTGDAKYRSLKKLILPYTNGKYIENFNQVFTKQSNEFVKVLGKKAGKGEFDIGKNVIHCIGDITFEVLLDIPGEAQQGNPDELILHGSDRMMDVMMERIGRIWEYNDVIFRLFNKKSQYYNSTATYTHKFVENIIEGRKKKYSEEKLKNIQPKNYRALIDVISGTMTESEMKHQLIGSIIGIHDTLHGILSFLFLMLAMHPEVQEKVREEIRQIAGDGIIDQEAITNMKYTHMVILETIRLFPVTPVFPRKTTEELKLATCTLPKGISILLFAFGTHRDPAHWTDPETFNPERFTPENSEDRHKFAFVPFSYGLRQCAGYNFALACLKIIIGDTVRHFKLSTTKKMKDIHLYMTISVRSTGGYPVSVERLI